MIKFDQESELRADRKDAGTAVSDEQMRFGPHRYPVDRYLDESSNKIEMVNIINDNWEPEPALRPEDELVLRRLHDMLRSTADDLRQLSCELAENRTPKVQVKSQPIPLDDDFNEKVHIEELVNAKFYGHKIIEQPLNKTFTVNRAPANKQNIITDVQVETVPTIKKLPNSKKLKITRTRIMEIDGNLDKNTKNKLNNGKTIKNAPPVAYKEFIFKHEDPKIESFSQNKLQIQDMPKINIRSELKVQKVLQLDIFPNNEQGSEETINESNVAVVAAAHEVVSNKFNHKITLTAKGPVINVPATIFPQTTRLIKQPVRKISKMSTCDSSGSVVSSDTQHNLKTQKQIRSVIRASPRPSARDRIKGKKSNLNIKEPVKHAHRNLEEWKKKINDIYGQPSTSKYKVSKQTNKLLKQTNLSDSKPERNLLNNAEYIPYSRLTLGGARVSDIEKEISNIPNKGDMPLSPIVDKILSSRENSFHNKSPRKYKKNESPRIFTTSDENLLQEVIDIEKKVSKINKTIKKTVEKPEPINLSISNESKADDKDSYADDFEEDQSDNSQKSRNTNFQQQDNNSNKESGLSDDKSSASAKELKKHTNSNKKKFNLSIKDSVDIFEFVHSVDTQENATQSCLTRKISLRETQTSPINDRPHIQPIHNDLWPMDPRGEVEKMFKLEKDFIKKLIVEEYGDFFEKNINKPSTSEQNTEQKQKNESASQKLTQTSPAHVKSVMTSPTRTKTRTTSPFLSLKVDHQTSPMVVVTNEEHLTVELDNDEDGISINLSSPRFSLRLPQTSREVLSNLEVEPSPNKTERNSTETPKNNDLAKLNKSNRKNVLTSSSSDVESSSEISSVGEVKFKLKKRYKKRMCSISESSESSYVSKTSSDLPSGGIIPLKSEGEVSFSLRQTMRKSKDSNKLSKSEGEASAGRCN